jgi:hypothetical protein
MSLLEFKVYCETVSLKKKISSELRKYHIQLLEIQQQKLKEMRELKCAVLREMPQGQHLISNLLSPKIGVRTIPILMQVHMYVRVCVFILLLLFF